jgi:hypothetical protein
MKDALEKNKKGKPNASLPPRFEKTRKIGASICMLGS